MKNKFIRFDFRIPPDLHKKLVAIAARERRSIHAQILIYVEQAVARAEIPQEKK